MEPLRVVSIAPRRDLWVHWWEDTQLSLFLILALSCLAWWWRRASRAAAQHTLRVLAQEDAARSQREAEMNTLLDNLMSGVVVHGADGALQRANRRACELLGLSPEQMAGKALIDPAWHFQREDDSIMPVEEYPAAQALARRATVSELVVGIVVPGRGHVTWVLCRADPELDAQGELLRVVVTFVDITQRTQAERENRVLRDQFEKLFDNNLDACLQTHVQTGEILAANAAACATFGMDHAELLRCNRAQLVDPDDPRLQGLLKHRAAQGRARGGIRMVRKDGSRFEAEVSSAAYRGVSGETYSSMVVRDVTARQLARQQLEAALQEQKALLREVHHRVKNNLQVITSLLRLGAACSGEPTVGSVLRDMQGRIRSMAFLHETLHRSDRFATVDMGRYLTQLANEAFRSQSGAANVRLQLDLAYESASLDEAAPCGLLVNELISNGFKHAFPDGRAGEVVVRLTPLDEAGVVRLSVGDNGIGLPADFARRRKQSLGFELVSDLAKQLRSEIRTGVPPGGGTVFFLDIRLATP